MILRKQEKARSRVKYVMKLLLWWHYEFDGRNVEDDEQRKILIEVLIPLVVSKWWTAHESFEILT